MSGQILSFGENTSDTDAIGHLIGAIRPDLPAPRSIRKPITLARRTRIEKRQKFGVEVGRLVKAAKVRGTVVGVVCHRDCDELEPAHVQNEAELRADLAHVDAKFLILAVPAEEIEAWWYLWPEITSSICSAWPKLPTRTGNVGRIQGPKESLQKFFRVKQKGVPTFKQSDGVKIAKKIKEGGLILDRAGQSESFESFYNQVVAARLS